jgi:hypothetical protein
MTEKPKVITLPRSHDDNAGWSKYFREYPDIDVSEYCDVYACPLCGWYAFHSLYNCGHCRGKLERLRILRTYYDEWKTGRMRTPGL